jgi:hypothetical protein
MPSSTLFYAQSEENKRKFRQALSRWLVGREKEEKEKRKTYHENSGSFAKPTLLKAVILCLINKIELLLMELWTRKPELLQKLPNGGALVRDRCCG